MRLKAADIDKILEQSSPEGGPRSAEDYAEESEAARQSIVAGLIAQSSQSTARIGTTLPPPPKSLRTHIEGPNDFGAKPSNVTLLEGEHTRIRETEVEVPVVPVPAPLRGGDLDAINCRADLMMLLTSNLPLNELGLPKIIYRADLLDWKLFQGNTPLGVDPTDRYKTMQQFLDIATLYLSYAEGFPALSTGEPLWAKLPFEQAEHYSAFTDYCTLVGQRQVAAIPGRPLDQLMAWYHEDYWAIRVKCYDMLNAIHAAKVREQRILSAESYHYKRTEIMLQKMEDNFEGINWEVLKADPDKYVATMERLIKLQRLALGQGSQAGDGKKEVKAESLEVTMRRIATPNIVEDVRGDGGIDVRQLLRNPEALASAQELIIRMSRTRTQETIIGDGGNGNGNSNE